VQQSVA